jgi:type VI secretion system protein ImpF
MAVKQRLTPTLFDKLVADVSLPGLRDSGDTGEPPLEAMRIYDVPRLERFNEAALRKTVRRELAWLLNTTNLSATQDLEAFPEVQTSVLNYGVPDLAGRSLHRRTVQQRAREIRTAIRTFEPRIDPESLKVEPSTTDEALNQIIFMIHGDITSAVDAMPVKFRTSLDIDSAAVDVVE